MIPANWLRAIGIGIPVFSAIVLFGIFNEMTVSTNFFNTGIFYSTILAIAQLILAGLIAKNYV